MGDYQKITGNGLNVIGDYNEVRGNGNNIVGDYNEVTGNGNNVVGDYNKIKGLGNNYTGDYNTVNGKRESVQKGKRGVIGLVGDQGGTVTVNTFGGPNGLVTHVFNNHPGSVIAGQTTVVSGGSLIDVVSKKESKKRQRAEAKEPQFIECPTETDVKEGDVALADDAPEGTPSCLVCLSQQPVCILMPCLHKCMCCRCARQLTNDGTKERGQVPCPICKAAVEKIGRVFE